jgi:hypothetical protein
MYSSFDQMLQEAQFSTLSNYSIERRNKHPPQIYNQFGPTSADPKGGELDSREVAINVIIEQTRAGAEWFDF